MAHAGQNGINAAANVAQGQPGSAGPYPPFSVQWRALLAQQGLGGLPRSGKTGLSFAVILSRLQGELQKKNKQVMNWIPWQELRMSQLPDHLVARGAGREGQVDVT